MRKQSTTISLPPDCWTKMDAVKGQWGSSYNFQVEMALRTFWKEDIRVVLKNMTCPHCKKPVFSEKK